MKNIDFDACVYRLLYYQKPEAISRGRVTCCYRSCKTILIARFLSTSEVLLSLISAVILALLETLLVYLSLDK